MKTLEQLRDYKSDALDGRDTTRLLAFVPFDELKEHYKDVKLKDGVTEGDWNEDVLPLTRENVLMQLEGDLEFAFEKALNQRGISSSMMYSVICMWNWILEEGLEDFDEYAQYGLPTYKATALKYGFANPIGDDTGAESKYEECY